MVSAVEEFLARLRANDHGARGRQGHRDRRLSVPGGNKWCSCRSRLATAIHRRIGSNLAPVEIAVALELVAIPGSISTVRRDDMVAGMVRGPRRLPILFRRETAHLSQPSEKLDGWAQRTVQTHRGN